VKNQNCLPLAIVHPTQNLPSFAEIEAKPFEPA